MKNNGADRFKNFKQIYKPSVLWVGISIPQIDSPVEISLEVEFSDEYRLCILVELSLVESSVM